ncbi:unnamed protein product [Orchesella dallaii]|uniref:EF-hand domain-containing protein n=1 Tax=Orchesella dallaii TaxID=48710 RepID=A0ABP1R013_9HEXA
MNAFFKEKSNRRIKRATREDLYAVFLKYASVEADGLHYITSEDFIRKFLGLHQNEDYDPKSVKLLAGIVDTSKDGHISFPEFMALEGILTFPDALYFIAFRLFDVNGNRLVSFDEFAEIISFTTLQQQIPFDLESPFSQLYFGKDRSRVIKYSEFSQFLHDFHEEYAIEAFRKFDVDGSGTISTDDFYTIMTTIRTHLLTEDVISNLKEVAHRISGCDQVSLPIFAAFNSVLNNIELLKRVYLTASDDDENKEISRKEFLCATQFINVGTPIEVDILFHLNELINKSPTLILADFQAIAPEQYYTKVNKRVLDIKAVQSPEQRDWVTELLESLYRFTLGSIAGAIEAIGAYPMDLIKSRMQIQRPGVLFEEPLYKSTWHCFKKTLKAEGVPGLYRGMLTQILGTSMGKAMKLSMNDFIRDKLMNRKGQVPLWGEFFAGATAGACNVFVIQPLEAIKIRVQTVGELFPKAKLRMVAVIKQLGFKGLYKGTAACMWRDVPFSALFFPTYAHTKIYLQDIDGYNTPISLLAAGLLAAIPGAPISMPFDVIKTRLQVDPRPGQVAYTGIVDAASRIMKEEGLRTFWQGTRVIKPSQFGITLLLYEVLQRYFYIDFAGTRPTGSEATVRITSVDQIKSEKPDHIGGFALAVPILSGIESKFGLVFPKFRTTITKPHQH